MVQWLHRIPTRTERLAPSAASNAKGMQQDSSEAVAPPRDKAREPEREEECPSLSCNQVDGMKAQSTESARPDRAVNEIPPRE